MFFIEMSLAFSKLFFTFLKIPPFPFTAVYYVKISVDQSLMNGSDNLMGTSMIYERMQAGLWEHQELTNKMKERKINAYL